MAGKKLNKDNIEHFLDNHLYIPTRTVWIGPINSDDIEVNAIMAEIAIKNIHILDSMSDDPINIIMINYGGEVTAGMAIYDAIRLCRSYVRLMVFGCANSMGSVILQAADERMLAPNAEVMLHFGSTSYPDDHSINNERKEEKRKKDDKKIIGIYYEKIKEKKPKITKTKVRDMILFDRFFEPEEAIEFGLADKIITSHKDD